MLACTLLYLVWSEMLTAGLVERGAGGVVVRMAEMTCDLLRALARPWTGTETETEGTDGAAGIWLATELPVRSTAAAEFLVRVSADAATAPKTQTEIKLNGVFTQ